MYSFSVTDHLRESEKQTFGGNIIEYMGTAALFLALAATFFWFRKAWKVNLPKTPRVFQSFWFLSFLLGIASTNTGIGSAGLWAIGVSTLLLVLTFTGKQKVAKEGIGVGDIIPDFTAETDDKKLFGSSDLAGSRILIKFFRAHW